MAMCGNVPGTRRGHTRLKLLAILTAQIFRTGPIDFRVGFNYIDLRRSMTIGAVREREPDHVEPPRIHLHRPRCLERDRPRVCGRRRLPGRAGPPPPSPPHTNPRLT